MNLPRPETPEDPPIRLYLRERDDHDDQHVRIDLAAHDELVARYYSDYHLDTTDDDDTHPVAIAISVSTLYAYPLEGLPPFTLEIPIERANSFNIELPSVREVGVVSERV